MCKKQDWESKGVTILAATGFPGKQKCLIVVSLQNRCDVIFLSSTFCSNFLDLMLLKVEATISCVCTTLSGRRP